MRTTVTLDDDVAARLSRLQKAQKKSFKALLNEALREGLKQMTNSPPRRKKYQTPTVDLGRCLVGNLDDVAEVLAIAEGESFQ
jgi:Ribbon-helix-helix protein, copG family